MFKPGDLIVPIENSLWYKNGLRLAEVISINSDLYGYLNYTSLNINILVQTKDHYKVKITSAKDTLFEKLINV